MAKTLPATSPSDRCPTCGRKKKRSTDANARYWSLLFKIADQYKPDGQQFSAETWHLQCKAYWLGKVDVTLPDGSVVVSPKSTADLSVDEFSDYMTKVEAWAASRDVYLDE